MLCISHAEIDSDAAIALEQLLVECTSLAPEDICRTRSVESSEFGELTSGVRAMIESSDAVVGIVSSDAAASRASAFELGAAWAMDKLMFLIFMPGIDFRDMPEILTNYPCAGTDGHDASSSLLSLLRELADFIGAKFRRSADLIEAIDRFLKASRERPTDDAEAASGDDEFGFGHPSLDDGESFSIVCVYDIVALGTPTAGRTVVTAPWVEIFKSFATSLDRPQDEEYIERLVIEFCKTRDASFAQNCQYGMYKKASVERYCFMRMLSHFEELGMIEKARAPHSAFQQKSDRRIYWQITELGGDCLRAAWSTHKALQEWRSDGPAHVQRGAVRKQRP